jgi:hypothetical protein
MSVSAERHEDELIELMRAYAQGECDNHCPRCGAEPLGIDDRSTPPYALWYAITCAGCGLDEVVHIPLGVMTSSG